MSFPNPIRCTMDRQIARALANKVVEPPLCDDDRLDLQAYADSIHSQYGDVAWLIPIENAEGERNEAQSLECEVTQQTRPCIEIHFIPWG